MLLAASALLLPRTGGQRPKTTGEPWLPIKEKDEYVRPATEYSVVDEMPGSVSKLDIPAPRDDTNAASHIALPKKKKAVGLPDLSGDATKATLPVTLQPQLSTLWMPDWRRGWDSAAY